MRHLRDLEDQSVYILREAYRHFDRLAMLWSMGKDSTVLLWLARKAFFGHVPCPLVPIDTGYEMPALIEYRDRLCREWRLRLVVGQNRAALAEGRHPARGQLVQQKGAQGWLDKPVQRHALSMALLSIALPSGFADS